MSTDARWIIGVGVAVVTSVVGSAVAVIAVMVTLVGGLREDMREDHAGFDARLRAVEVAFGKVDQRLLTIERVVLPAPAPGE